MLGVGARSERKGAAAAISDQQIGLGGVTGWKLASIDHNTCVGFVFDVGNTHRDSSEAMQAL